MCSNDPVHDLTASSHTSHMSWQRHTTWHPADVFSSEPLHGLVQPSGYLHRFAPSDAFLADSNATQEGSQCCPIGPAQVMGHVSTAIDPRNLMVTVDNTAKQLTEPTRRARQMVRVAPTTCQWQYLGMPICGQDITRESVPTHLAVHGIHKMHKDCVVQCRWQGCESFVKRESMTRHCREVHLRLKRKAPKSDAFSWDIFVIDVF